MDILTYAQSKKYTDGSILGIDGVLRGKNCTIKSIEKIDGVNTVTFQWTADDGTVKTSTMQVLDGLPVTTEAITSNVSIGSITPGKTYPIGTEVQDILKDILTQYTPPSVTLTINPNAALYDIISDSVSQVAMNAVVTKKTSDVSKLEFFVNDTLVHTVDTNISNGGTFLYIYNPATPIRTDTKFKVVVTDIKNGTSDSTKNIKFVAKSYYGIVDANIGAPTESIVKTLTAKLKDTKNLTYDGITTDWGKVCYAYPTSFGNLTSIKDMINNLNYTTEFTKTTLTVDGIDYVCYTQTNASASVNVQLTFV